MAEDCRFAGFPSAVVYKEPVVSKEVKAEPVQHLLWGDWLKLEGSTKGDWLKIWARSTAGWIHKDSIQNERLLEIVFVDIGQGDGCLIATPWDKHIIVDAGQSDNMFRFLRWKFGKFEKEFTFESAIITHPDTDHYQGFKPLFDEPKVRFKNIFHNGIVERGTAKNPNLGRTEKVGKTKYLVDIVSDIDALDKVDSSREYAVMLKNALTSGRVDNIQMLSASNGHLPGYRPDNPLCIRVLGPVPEPDQQDNLRLRWIEDIGKTKNGHSIILRLQYKNVSVLLGGDLNSAVEYFLLGHYTEFPSPPEIDNEEKFMKLARKHFESDVAKSCHHGSGDFTDLFLRAINPIATVISSGDNEPHSHPRSDALGTIGRHSRGARPLIFSTELARSAKENIKHPFELREKMGELQRAIAEAKTEAAKKKAQEAFDKQVNTIDRSIAVYGAINLRTDGEKVVIAQKIERPSSQGKKWDIYVLKQQDGCLQYESKYE